MIGGDGRVRVMDFGLARAHGEPQRGRAEPLELTTTGAQRLTAEVTHAGAIMGTPAYMSPEQFRGELVTEAADQFAFCVSLWELLYGLAPFAGESVPALAHAVHAGELRAPPRGRRAPRWLRAVCERGLSPDPARRFPSMDALLDALSSGQRGARVRRVAATLGALALLGIGIFGARHVERGRAAAACERARHEVEQTWDASARDRVRVALLATGLSFAETSAANVLSRLDGYAEAWGAGRERVCLNRHVDRRWSDDVHARARWCLEDRRLVLEALVEEFSAADEAVAQNAVAAAANLEGVARCLDESAVARFGAPPTEHVETIQSIRAQLSKAEALTLAGQYERGRVVAEDALGRAESLEWRPLIASVRAHVGVLQERSGAFDDAVASLKDAYFEAAEEGASEVAELAASALVYTLGYKKAAYDEGLTWARLAELELRADFDEGERALRRAQLEHNRAAVLYSRGSFEEARDLYLTSVELRERALGPGHPEIGRSLSNLAASYLALGDLERALDSYTRVRAIYEEALGAEHPRVAFCLTGIANIHKQRRRFDEARALYERVLVIRERALGAEHPEVGLALGNAANADLRVGELDRARRRLERAMAIFERAHGPKHPHVASTQLNLALVLTRTLRYDEAEALYERALEGFESTVGPEHANVALVLVNLGNLYIKTENTARAAEVLERARAIELSRGGGELIENPTLLVNLGALEESRGEHAAARARYEQVLALGERSDDPAVEALARGHLARLELALGRPALAVPHAERALALALEDGATGLAEYRFTLAQALSGAGRERSRARALAEAAADELRRVEHAAERVAELERWLAAR